MLLALLVIIFAVLLAFACAFIGVLLGQHKIMARMVTEARRRERRKDIELTLWQTKTLEQAGLGRLRRNNPVPKSDEPQQPGRRIVAPSQAIADQKKVDAQGLVKAPAAPKAPEVVPAAIQQPFLQDLGPVIPNRGEDHVN